METKNSYEYWHSMSSSVFSGVSAAKHTGSTSSRCFQIQGPVSEQLLGVNYYGGTPNFTPGPGSYHGKYYFEVNLLVISNFII